MKKLLSILLVIGILVAFVSCDGFSFGESEATKGVTTVNFKLDSSSNQRALSNSYNLNELIESYYWFYNAQKTDGGPSAGGTSDYEYVALKSNETGLDNATLTGLSVGQWQFTLHPYTTNSNTEETYHATAFDITVSCNLSVGVSNTISVPIVPSSTSGEGTLKLSNIVRPSEGNSNQTWTYSVINASTSNVIASNTNVTLPATGSYLSDSDIIVDETSDTDNTIPSGTYKIIITGTYGTAPNQSTRSGQILATVFEGLTTTVSGSIDDLKAQLTFSAKACLLTYDANWDNFEGILPADQLSIQNSAVTTSLLTGSRTGYTFAGWSTSKTDGTFYKVGEEFNLTNDTTLYAIWTDNTTKGAKDSGCGPSLDWVQLWNNGPKWLDHQNLTESAGPGGSLTSSSSPLNNSTKFKFGQLKSGGYLTSKTDEIQGTSNDTVISYWNNGFQMPTKSDFEAMKENCTFTFCDGVAHTEAGDGHKQYVPGCSLVGIEVRGKGEYQGNTIFIPLPEENGGYYSSAYWTSSWPEEQYYGPTLYNFSYDSTTKKCGLGTATTDSNRQYLIRPIIKDN